MTSKACCNLAPVSDTYCPQGKYETIAGFNTYVVGPPDASKGIIHIHDIFSFTPQTIQGSDRLAALTGALVLLPDFYKGERLPDGTIPSDTPEKQATLYKFIGGPGKIEDGVKGLLEIRNEIAAKYPSAEGHWGVFGLCWGGKVAVLACGEGNEGQGRKFNVSGTAHPGLLDAKDAEAQTAPHIMLPSSEEPADVVEQYKEILGRSGHPGGEIETYPTMHHGWMGARADLKNVENVKEYTRGYEQAASFLNRHL